MVLLSLMRVHKVLSLFLPKINYMIRNLLCAILLFSVTGAYPASVNKESAHKIAVNFYLERTGLYGNEMDLSDVKLSEVLVKETGSIQYYYVFTFEPAGFVIVSAEDVLPPVLGYAIDGTYRHDDQPDSYRNFMQTYCDAIDFIRLNNIEQDSDIKALWEQYSTPAPASLKGSPAKDAVAPLLTCKWDQGYPYNYYCPEDAGGPGGRVYAGCVATAMSQVMYYWRYPVQGTGSHSYYCYPYGTQTANYGATTYQWESMTNSIPYYHPEAIAELQYHCGVGVEMMYGPDGSGAYSHDVPPVLEDYFGYSSDCYFTQKEDHSNQEWISLLKDNLDNAWPMYYSGYSNSGGHAFVCDGYQDDYFHFNFGWSGSSDGYYSLLNVGGFSSGQGAVMYTYPESNYPVYCSGDHTITGKHGSVEDGSGPIDNYEHNADCSWLIAPESTDDSISNITIFFVKMDIHNSDILTIYDGPGTQSPVLGTYTGSELPGMITSTSNKVYVTFETDASGTSQGWLIEFRANSPDFCQGISILEEPESSLEDGSGSFMYHNNSTCMWKIMPEAGPVTLFFTAFDTENTVDRVQIYDIETEELLAEYSGTYTSGNLPAPVTAYSGKMFIAFATNGTNTHEGWSAFYTTYTGRDETGSMNRLRILPNPAKDKIRIELPAMINETMQIQFRTVQGVLVRDENHAVSGGNQIELDIQELAPAIYIITVTGASGSFIERLIVR